MEWLLGANIGSLRTFMAKNFSVVYWITEWHVLDVMRIISQVSEKATRDCLVEKLRKCQLMVVLLIHRELHVLPGPRWLAQCPEDGLSHPWNFLGSYFQGLRPSPFLPHIASSSTGLVNSFVLLFLPTCQSPAFGPVQPSFFLSSGSPTTGKYWGN